MILDDYKLFGCTSICVIFTVFYYIIKQYNTNLPVSEPLEIKKPYALLKKNQYQFKIKKCDNNIDIDHYASTISQILIELYEKNKITQNKQIDLILENRKITLNDCNNYYTICRSDLLSILKIIIDSEKK